MGDRRGAWRIGGYVADELIGYGASAQVWRGHVGRTSEPVALKVLDLGDPSAVRAARAEAALLSTLDHPHLVRFRELVPDGQSIVLVLELAVGGSMADLLARRERLSPGEVVGAIAPVTAALAYVHDEGVVHSDVAPANILFRADGSPVLADLGVARLLGGIEPPRSTLAYVDPWVAAGGVPSQASDVFMAAATALHALTGAPPWRGSTVEELLADACTGEIDQLDDRLATVPAAVVDVIRRGLSMSPGARGSAAEFALDLRHAAAPLPVDLTAGRPRYHQPLTYQSLKHQPPQHQPLEHQHGDHRPSDGAGRFVDEATMSAGFGPRPDVHQPRHAAPVRSAATLGAASSVPLDRPAFTRPDSRTRGAEGAGVESVAGPPSRPPLALTHIVRTRVRSSEVAPPLGVWARWRVDGRWRLPIALLAVVLLIGSGVAWLRWGPVWRRATAAPMISGGPVARPAGTTLDPPAVTSTPPMPPPAQRTLSSTDRTPTSTAPTKPRAAGKPTASSSGRSAPDGDAHWSAVLDQLDRHRQTAFATDDPTPLAAVYVPGTLLRQDVAALHQVVGPGCRLFGLRTRYQRVRVSSTAAQQVVLDTQASLDAASLQCPGAPARRMSAHRMVAMTVVLVPNGSSYLISGIDVSG